MSAKIVLTPASAIPIRAVKWLWQERMPLGELVLLAGREGAGKSTLDVWITAMVTTGKMPGDLRGQPRNVLVAATEDDWGTTIRPRLQVAGADLDRVFRIDVTVDDREGTLSLPDDLDQLEAAIEQSEAALLVLSPLMSRLGAQLDSHKDQEVRQSLEPLVAIMQRHRCTVLGLIHLNKGGGHDPLRAIMASTAFVAVARAVMFVQRDPEDHDVRVLGQPKNNMGRTDPDLGGMPQYVIEAKAAGTDANGDLVTATRLRWLAESRPGTIDQMLAAAGTAAPSASSATNDAADWLRAYLEDAGGQAERQDVASAAASQGFNDSTLRRARERLQIDIRSTGYPRRTVWELPKTTTVNGKPVRPGGAGSLGGSTTGMTGTTTTPGGAGGAGSADVSETGTTTDGGEA